MCKPNLSLQAVAGLSNGHFPGTENLMKEMDSFFPDSQLGLMSCRKYIPSYESLRIYVIHAFGFQGLFNE